MQTSRTLIVGRLSVQSSYLRNEESPAASEHFDTVQWFLGPTVAWRIRTYAVDCDIHLHRVDPVAGLIELALQSTQSHYAEVLAELVRVELTDCLNEAQASRELCAALGAAGWHYAEDLDMGFWNPSELHYSTKSTPV